MMRFLLVLVLVSAGASAQPARLARPAWFSVGGGVGSGTDRLFVGGSMGLTAPVGPGHGVFHVGTTLSGKLALLGPADRVSELHLAYGASVAGRKGVVAFVVGPALASVVRADERDVRSSASLGGYASVQALSTQSRRVAFGVEAYAHVSPDLSTVGGRVVLAIGSF